MIERLAQFVSPPERRALLADIAYYRACIRAAGPAHSASGKTARAAYGPFIERRMQLLAALADGHAHDWRDYPFDARASASHAPSKDTTVSR